MPVLGYFICLGIGLYEYLRSFVERNSAECFYFKNAVGGIYEAPFDECKAVRAGLNALFNMFDCCVNIDAGAAEEVNRGEVVFWPGMDGKMGFCNDNYSADALRREGVEKWAYDCCTGNGYSFGHY